MSEVVIESINKGNKDIYDFNYLNEFNLANLSREFCILEVKNKKLFIEVSTNNKFNGIRRFEKNK